MRRGVWRVLLAGGNGDFVAFRGNRLDEWLEGRGVRMLLVLQHVLFVRMGDQAMGVGRRLCVSFVGEKGQLYVLVGQMFGANHPIEDVASPPCKCGVCSSESAKYVVEEDEMRLRTEGRE